MFVSHTDVIGLWDLDLSGESHDDDFVYRLTCAEAASDMDESKRQELPSGLENDEPSLFTAVVVSAVDRSQLNGHDAVRLMQTEARLSSHCEASKLATMVEVAKSPACEVDVWDYTVRNEDGTIQGTGTVRRRPLTAQRRNVAAAYPTCVHPGCRMPVHNRDLDHRHPWAHGGPTQSRNLAPLCRHHHMLKHHAPWKLERQANGEHKWTNPLNQTYINSRGPPG